MKKELLELLAAELGLTVHYIEDDTTEDTMTVDGERVNVLWYVDESREGFVVEDTEEVYTPNNYNRLDYIRAVQNYYDGENEVIDAFSMSSDEIEDVFFTEFEKRILNECYGDISAEDKKEVAKLFDKSKLEKGCEYDDDDEYIFDVTDHISIPVKLIKGDDEDTIEIDDDSEFYNPQA